ncbi:hypothetical protein [Curtobacterium sp. BH-2-1-1]|uniref:hypothetical protein n=1 Tax=Curtobacterium sp. BH-2-1-1 TaxID=1905847 RepID=UPI00119DD1C6|nr:hypothetical protein [Curtobacterium sp. BH-2-1-1]
MPSWTDIGGFWVSVGGFALAIVLAVVGWIQAHGAKEDAKVAKQHADAAQEQASTAKRIADEAQRQTAAAEAAAEAAREQAEAAVAALDWETIPQLQVVATERHRQWVISNRDRYEIQTSEWFVVNTGRAAAHRLSVRLDFGTNSVVTIGPNNFAQLPGGAEARLGMVNVPMPAFEDLTEAGHVPKARLKYDTPTGQPKDETKTVLPKEQQ